MIIRKRNQKGFTLIELMIVVGIIAILAVIAIPGYQQYVLRSYRVEARNALQEMASHWQKHYSVTRQWNKLGDGSTVSANTLPAQWGLANVPASGTARYQITVVELSETKYLLKATALGAQAKDRCGAFFLNQSGTKMATAGTGDAAPAGGRDPLSLECWSK